MICVAIKGPSIAEAYRQTVQALEYADLIELRLDCFAELTFETLENFCSQFSIPMIFCLRSSKHGGDYLQSEENRLAAISSYASLKPAYLDLESYVDPHYIEGIISLHPEIKVILSYHNFAEIPANMDEIFQHMRKIPACFYKIAVTPKNCVDALRLIIWSKQFDEKLIVVNMGVDGQFSRIIGPVFRCPLTYASLEDGLETAPGQLSAKMLVERYHYRSLNFHTAIYGLIGDPVSLSISDETHNYFITECGLDAIYVKIQVAAEDLSLFLHYAKQLPFQGLSVTMPLKEKILPHLDWIDPQASEIGAVNTLHFKDGKIHGYNTDGIGALNAIEKEISVNAKHIVLIGAGGASKAIAFEAVRRGSKVTILNRNVEKVLEIGERLNCAGSGLESIKECAEAGYDVLINCTPLSMPISTIHILSQAFVMDIVTNPKETAFLKAAAEKKCRIIYGYRMFVEQAIGQFNIWFEEHAAIQKNRKDFEQRALKVLQPKGIHV